MSKITIRILRGEGRSPGRLASFDVEVDETTTVLGVLCALKAENAPDLAFRAACRHGVCGECAMRIQGQPALACVTRIAGVSDRRGRVTVEPLANLPVVRDLVVDRSGFWSAYRSAKPWLVRDAGAPGREHLVLPEEVDALLGADRCVHCAACVSACPVASPLGAFAGPHALLHLHARAVDPRDTAIAERLDTADACLGAYRCHGAFACLGACPKDIEPVSAIYALRKLVARRDEVVRQRAERQAALSGKEPS
jgi:succinate dehydrogenase/fumarate reductase iron-sulfur protein